MSFMQEFKEFALKGNALDLAVAVGSGLPCLGHFSAEYPKNNSNQPADGRPDARSSRCNAHPQTLNQ